tara:strand:+ start:580 stop:783 length:204 start_codon:yes stop_codon:yes gene_type:complete
MNEYKFTRDDFSKAVLNTDLSALEQYKLARNQRLKEQSILKNCVNDINILKEDMQEIKNLLIKMGEK